MSNYGLRVFIGSQATISDIEEFLNVQFADVPEDSDSSFSDMQMRTTFGGIELTLEIGLHYSRESLDDIIDNEAILNPEYSHQWNMALVLRNTYRWNGVRDVLGLALSAWLFEKFEGVYLGQSTSGVNMFYIEQGKLILNSDEIEYFSRFPLPYLPVGTEFGSLSAD